MQPHVPSCSRTSLPLRIRDAWNAVAGNAQPRAIACRARVMMPVILMAASDRSADWADLGSGQPNGRAAHVRDLLLEFLDGELRTIGRAR